MKHGQHDGYQDLGQQKEDKLKWCRKKDEDAHPS
jgi:hypothetical protein